MLVPSGRSGQRIRVAIDHNPEFYRIFLDPRRYKSGRQKPRSPGRRQRVEKALQRIAQGKPFQRDDWIGWELLEILTELHARDLERGYEEPS